MPTIEIGVFDMSEQDQADVYEGLNQTVSFVLDIYAMPPAEAEKSGDGLAEQLQELVARAYVAGYNAHRDGRQSPPTPDRSGGVSTEPPRH